ncbi:DUF4276 family protein [Candidatus Poribacteria bacterium]|nr:DUF4276 family protein [Candidatus Poribacteria bacterium]
MHFEVLVEDQSGKKALDVLLPKILHEGSTFRLHSYRGIGRIPRDLRGKTDPDRRILLDLLPSLLRAFGKAYAKTPNAAAIIVVCDLDDRCLRDFRSELMTVLESCDPKPVTRFCIAVEEMEAWFLGDLPAILAAYPKAKRNVLDSYANDSVCGTWEKLADAIHPGGSKRLKPLGYPEIGVEKSKWAEAIAPKVDVENSRSPSFCYFRDKLRALAG